MEWEKCARELGKCLTWEQKSKYLQTCTNQDVARILLADYTTLNLDAVKRLFFEPKYALPDEIQPILGQHVVKLWKQYIKNEPEFAHEWYADLLSVVQALKDANKVTVIDAMKGAGLNDLLSDYIIYIRNIIAN